MQAQLAWWKLRSSCLPWATRDRRRTRRGAGDWVDRCKYQVRLRVVVWVVRVVQTLGCGQLRGKLLRGGT